MPYLKLKPPITCTNIAPSIAIMYAEFSKQKIGVGLPLNIIQIYPDNRFKEISSFTPMKYKNPQKLVEAILAGKIKVTYHYPWAKDFLFKQLKSGMKETTF